MMPEKADKPLKIVFKKGINPKKVFPDASKIIVYAFSLGDKDYFRFDDLLNVPYERALKTLIYYKEVDMNVDRQTLEAHCDAIENVYKKTQLTMDDLTDIRLLTRQLRAKLSLPKETDLMYKFAAVVYFDQHESPTNYEFKYGENKIRFWKKNVDLTAFFLSRPLQELIPYLQHAGENLEQFSRMTANATDEYLQTLFPMLSDEQRMNFKDKLKLSLGL